MAYRRAEPRADDPQAKAEPVTPAAKVGHSKVEPTLAPMSQPVPSLAWKKSPGYRKAVAYVEKIKARFENGVAYKLFLHLLQMALRDSRNLQLVLQLENGHLSRVQAARQ